MRLLQCAMAKQNERTKRALIMSEFGIQRFESDKKGMENKCKDLYYRFYDIQMSKGIELQHEQDQIFCSSR